MGIVLGANQYGKAESRVVRIYRDTARHEIRDLNVSSAIRGDFSDAHVTGDQAEVLPTDTQKNTAFAFAKEHGVDSPEEYAVRLGSRLLEATPAATGVLVRVEEYPWERVAIGPDEHDHTFVRRGGEVRTVEADVTADGVRIESGLTDLVVLKSTDSEFKGFLRDEYTTLADADDRILATSLTARWRHAHDTAEQVIGADWDEAHRTARATLLEAYAGTYSHALQETLYAMGRMLLERVPTIAEVSFAAPNKHHFLVDLAPFGLDNPGEVFIAADRPYGLIEATVAREPE
ncbi:MAG TPA: urate oxidase [Nocardioides sp.]|nr:urate oxidase [Nocardioides sp.]